MQVAVALGSAFPAAAERLRSAADIIAPALVVVTVLSVGLLTITPFPVGAYYDDGLYVVLAKALATGEGYRYLNLPGAPAATHYPPGYPFFLSLLWRLWPEFPANVWLFKAANALLLAAAAAGTYALGRTRLGFAAPVAAATAVAFTAAIPMLILSSALLSETLFIAMALGALIVCERAVEKGDWRSAVAAGLLCGLVALVRSAGVAVLGGVVLVLLLRKQWRGAAAAAGAALAVLLPWNVWVALHAGEVASPVAASYGSYLSWLGEARAQHGMGFFADVLLRNASEILRPLRVIFTPRLLPLARPVFLVLFVAVLLAGAWRLWRRAPVTAAFLAGYFGLVLLWPYGPDRFLFTVWPLIGVTLVLGTAWLAGEVTAREAAFQPGLRSAAITLLVSATFSLAAYVDYNVRGFANRWWESIQRGGSAAAAPLVEWVLRNTGPDDVIASDSDPVVYLYSGRRAVPAVSWSAADYIHAPDAAERAQSTLAIVSTFDARYVLVPSRTSRAAPGLALLISSADPPLTMVDTLPRGGAVFTRTSARPR